MYTGLALIYLACTLLVGTWWPLLTLLPPLLGIRTMVINPEEQYLATRFGQDYAGYTQRTTRWL